ncbi:unnamed protein product [Porites evermanni]|uniref:Uncharacterized protein n=1 Tax=Porites evermanni TaxID=104178 RepID=A0ABN8RHG7_9CNID|nr:unnamed protein product [Porites evermanni]
MSLCSSNPTSDYFDPVTESGSYFHVEKSPPALPRTLTYPEGLLRKTSKSRLSQQLERRITVTHNELPRERNQ